MLNEMEKISIESISTALEVNILSVQKWLELQIATRDANDKQLYEDSENFNRHLDLNNKIEIGNSQFSRSYILFMTDRIAYKEQLDLFNSDVLQLKIESVKKVIIPLYDNDYRLCLLINKLQKKRITPFIGAGFSMGAGLPGWTKFLKSTAKSCGLSEGEVDSLLNNGDYEGCADLILSKTHPDLLREKFQTYFKEPSKFTFSHEVLARMANWGVVTTNYDRLLERTYEKFDSSFSEVFIGPEPEMHSEFIDGNHVLLKMHGDINRASKRVLTKLEYDKVYGSNEIDLSLPLPKFFSSFFSNVGILFVGCSLSNDRTMKLMKKIKDENETVATHFALVPLPESEAKIQEREKHLVSHGILPIWYPLKETDNETEKHELVESILAYLQDSIG